MHRAHGPKARGHGALNRLEIECSFGHTVEPQYNDHFGTRGC